MIVVERSSVVPLPAEQVWQRVTSPEGIRDEFRPVLSMTMPPGLRGRGLEDADDVVGRPLGKAWLLLLGVLPVEFDDMTLAALGPGRRFHEVSRMGMVAHWEHERSVTETGPAACEVSDRLTFRPRLDRLPLVRRLSAALVGAIFTHRHRRLARWAAR